MTAVRFGTITIMLPDAAEHLKNIHRLPQRDAYVGGLGPHDSELARGNYDWWGLPDKSVMYATGADRDAFRKWCNDNPVPLPEHRDDAYYAKLSQRAEAFVDSRAWAGQKIYYMPKPNPLEAVEMGIKRFIRRVKAAMQRQG